MSDSKAKPMEGTPVDAQCLDIHREGNSPTQWDEVPWVTTPIDIAGLADSLLRVSVENPSRQAPVGPTVNMRHEVSKLDVGPH